MLSLFLVTSANLEHKLAELECCANAQFVSKNYALVLFLGEEFSLPLFCSLKLFHDKKSIDLNQNCLRNINIQWLVLKIVNQ
jgi:hypothetical protein